MNGKYKSRKWKVFIAVLVMEMLITIAAALKMILSTDSIIISSLTGFMLANIGAVNATLGFYFTANVMQKKIVPPPKENI